MLLFRMSRTMSTLFEKILGKKLIIFHGRSTPWKIPWKYLIYFFNPSLKWWVKWLKMIFRTPPTPLPHPPPKKYGMKKNDFGWKMNIIKVVPNCLKWQENWLKIVLKFLGTYGGGDFGSEIQKKSCSKLSEMARKSVNKYFRFFVTP